MNGEEVLCAYEKMLLIRMMEERISALYKGDTIPGFVHTSIGQEACAVGALTHARVSDVITSTHRGHGHVLAKGLEPDRMMAELMGKVTGANNGRGGSMHVADPRLGIFGANGIVGAGLPIAVGAAFAAKDRGEGDLVVAFFGDGAIATGAFHEAMNMAALWKLPIIFLCENNGFSEFSSTVDQHPVPISARAAGYGMKSITLAGNDVEAVADGIRPVYEQVRGSGGPVFVEVTTLRVHGHYEGDPQVYRDKDEMARDILAGRSTDADAWPTPRARHRGRSTRSGGQAGEGGGRRGGAFRAVVAATGGVERDGVHLFAASHLPAGPPRRGCRRGRRGRVAVQDPQGGARRLSGGRSGCVSCRHRRCRRKCFRSDQGIGRKVSGSSARYADLRIGNHGSCRRLRDGGP